MMPVDDAGILQALLEQDLHSLFAFVTALFS